MEARSTRSRARQSDRQAQVPRAVPERNNAQEIVSPDRPEVGPELQAYGAPHAVAARQGNDSVDKHQNHDVHLKSYQDCPVRWIECTECKQYRPCSPEYARKYGGKATWECDNADKRAWFSSEESCEDANICELVSTFLSPKDKDNKDPSTAVEVNRIIFRPVDLSRKSAKDTEKCVDFTYLFLAVRSFGSWRNAFRHKNAMEKLVLKLGLKGADLQEMVTALSNYYQQVFFRGRKFPSSTVEMYLLQQESVWMTIKKHQESILLELGVSRDKILALKEALAGRKDWLTGKDLPELLEYDNFALHRSEGVAKVLGDGADALDVPIDVLSRRQEDRYVKLGEILKALVIASRKESQQNQPERCSLLLMGASGAGKSSTEDWLLRASEPDRYLYCMNAMPLDECDARTEAKQLVREKNRGVQEQEQGEGTSQQHEIYSLREINVPQVRF
jgi:hypothetical protein